MILIEAAVGAVSVLAALAAALYWLPRKTGTARAVVMGLAFMVAALITQSIFQAMPSLYILLTNGMNAEVVKTAYVSLERAYPLLIAAFVGLMAGFWQELAKFFAVKHNNADLAHWVGFGFALVDIGILLIGIGITEPAVHAIASAPGIALVVLIAIALQAPFSIAFHTGTAAFLKDGSEKGKSWRNFLTAVAVHSYIDGSLVYSGILVILFGYQESVGFVITWIPAVIISAAFVFYLRKYLKANANIAKKK